MRQKTTSETMPETMPETTTKPRTAKRRKPKPRATLTTLSQADRQAKRLAVSILEVLGGVRTPSEAAESLGVSLPRYYALEARALEGLVAACAKRSVGPRKSPERQIAKLEREIERLESECARHQALLRVAQRSVGLPATLDRSSRKSASGGAKRRRRRPTTRALRIARVLGEGEGAATVESTGDKVVETPRRASENGKEVTAG